MLISQQLGELASCPAGGVSSAEAVVKWLEVHPDLHTNHSSEMLDVKRPETLDAQEELDRLKPLVHALEQQQ